MSDVRIINADCLDALAELPDASVDCVVTDPPYGLEFMGKEWDRLTNYGGITSGNNSPHARRHSVNFTGSPNPTCRICGGLRSLKSEGSGGRFRCKCSSPDFPHYAAKAGKAMQEWHQQWATAVLRVLKPGGYMLCFGGTRTYHRLACGVEDAGFEIRDCLMWVYGSGFPKGKGCLKPAYEPILLCRRPGAKVLPLGIDECRVEMNGETVRAPQSDPKNRAGVVGSDLGFTVASVDKFQAAQLASIERLNTLGRWPANLVHDGSDEVMGRFAEFGPTSTTGKRSERSRNAVVSDTAWLADNHRSIEYANEPPGTAARFFYCAKASRSERGEGNSHPTVKPLALMEWLIKLVAREGETVLDPFLGSGTTALAALNTGRKCIGIERNTEYAEIAQRRVDECVGKLFAEAV